MKLKLPRYLYEHTVVHTPGNYLIYIIHHTCYKVNRKLACFTSSRCCHVRAREETEPNRERSDSRRRGEKRRARRKKKGASFTHARLQHPPLPSPSLPAPRSPAWCALLQCSYYLVWLRDSLASYLTTTHRIVFDTLDTQTTLISMLSALPLSPSLSLEIKRTLNVVGSAEEQYVRFSLSALTLTLTLFFFRSVSVSLSPFSLLFSVFLFLSLSLSKSSSQQPPHPCHSYCRRTHMTNVSSM